MVNYGELVATPNTKLLLHLNGNSADASGNGNNGTDTSISYVNGVFGQGASLVNASNSYISLPAGVRQPGNFTFSAWINPASVTSKNADNQVVIISEWSGVSRNYLLDQRLQKLGFLNGNGSSSNDALLLTGDILNAGVWYLATFIRNGTTIKIYLNGKEVATQTGSYSGGTTTSNIKLGIDNFASNSYGYDGLIDEVIIENRAWSATEVSNYYNQSKGVYAPKMI